MVIKEKLGNTIALLPDKPGIYQFIDKSGTIIYIGKAKDLRKRVSSYFTASKKSSYKTEVLVRKIAGIKHVIVENESDALLLENNFIKKYLPRYNVLLKDDKTFPWICIKKERFPRVFMTRRLEKDGSEYFGPYTSALMVRTLLNLVKQLYNLRNCNYNLSEENINKGKYKVCLEYHLGNCKGPCEKLQSEQDYNSSIIQIRQILKGNLQHVINYLNDLMKQYASGYQFEEADLIKKKTEVLEKFRSKSTVVSSRINNIDVFSIVDEENVAYVNYLKVVKGAIIQSHTIEMVKRIEENREELLSFAIVEIRERLKSDSGEIIVPFKMDVDFKNAKTVVPIKGDKKKLLELSYRNAKNYQREKSRQKADNKVDKRTDILLNTLKHDLRLKELPYHIECFDISNIQGANTVASCVVFRNSKPSKKEYRHFVIKTVKGINDFASMEEVVFRRFKRLTEENESLPQLVIIDGGKGQLNAALKSLQTLELKQKPVFIGIAKRLEEIYFPGDPVPLYLNKNSQSLKLIQSIRNEAHRFGIEFHRKRRIKSSLKSEIDNIQGIGDKTIQKLLQRFNDMNAVKNAGLEQLADVIGVKKANVVYEYFRR
jgi:excinuclease ABC subunit C